MGDTARSTRPWHSGRGTRPGRHDWRAGVWGRDLLAQGRDVAPCGGRNAFSRDVLSAGPRRVSPPGSKSVGAAGRAEPESAMAETGPTRRSTYAVGRRLWVVHRKA